MAEVTARGGGLPRGLPQRARGRGRGRGRGGSHSQAESHPTPNGLEHRVNGHRAPSDKYSAQTDEPVELKNIRRKHGHNLATIKELFPNWTDEDLLMALNEAAGDLELAAARISEGLTEQWGSVKTKKDKKLSSPVNVSSQHSRAQGVGTNHVHDGRPGRGRSDAPRGSPRGGGRGAAPRGVGRGQFTTASIIAAPSATEDSTNASTTPTTWGATVSVSEEPIGTFDTPAALPSGVSQSVDTWPASQTAQDPQVTNNQTSSEMTNGTVESSKWIPQTHKKPISRVITPGAKMSWAQVARPVDPPKVQVASTASAPPPGSLPIASVSDGHSNLAPQAEPTETIAPLAAVNPQLHDGQVAINIPDSTSDVWHTEPVPALDDLKANLAGTGPNVWNDDLVPQPLGIGEGWADAVLAQPSESKASIFDHQAGNQIVLTPSDSANIGPIELSTPSATVPIVEPPSVSILPSTNVADRATQVPEAVSIMCAASQQPNTLTSAPSSILAPPGLTKRTSTRKGQEAAVVMPGSGTPSMDRMGLKFGSLSLFGDTTETGEPLPAASRDAPSPPATVTEEALGKEAGLKPDDSQIENALTPPQPIAELVKSPSPPGVTQAMEEQPAPPQLIHPSAQAAVPVQHAQPQSANPATPASVQATQPPSSTFSSRYPSNNQYTAVEPTVAQQTNSTSQATQPQQQDAFSHYPSFRQDPMAAYFQQQQQQQQQQSAIVQHSPSPAPASQSSAVYGTFNHMNQQVPQQSQQPTQNAFGQAPQSAQDYAAIYGQEALRSLGYYDTYAHAQAAQAPQAAFPSRSDDSVKSTASAQTIAPPSQPQQVGLHQHHHQPQQAQQQQQQPAGSSVSTANQQYPGMQPSPMPYPYYPYYQQYGQLPPNYQNPSYPYALQGPSPYYSVQGSQQYQAANTRGGQSQYPMQGGPGSSIATVPNSLPPSHGHQPQHASQHGLGGVGAVVNNAGFRQASQPGAGTSQIPAAQASGQGIMTGNSGLVSSGGNSGMPPNQQPSSMHQQHAYYTSGYGGYAADPQQTQQGVGGMSGSTNTGHHHHHHHQAQQQHVTRQSGHHQHHHGGVQSHVGGVPAGGSGGGGQGSNDRKDPFNFSSDRFFSNQ